MDSSFSYFLSVYMLYLFLCCLYAEETEAEFHHRAPNLQQHTGHDPGECFSICLSSELILRMLEQLFDCFSNVQNASHYIQNHPHSLGIRKLTCHGKKQ